MGVERPRVTEAVRLRLARELDHARGRRVRLQHDTEVHGPAAPRLSSAARAAPGRRFGRRRSIATPSALLGESSIAACEIGGSDCAKIIAVGTPARSRSRRGAGRSGSDHRLRRRACDRRRAGDPTSAGSNGVGVALKTSRTSSVHPNSSAASAQVVERLGEHRCQRARDRGGAGRAASPSARDGGDHTWRRVHAPDGGDAAVVDRALANRERGPSRGGERVPPQAHRRRAGVSRLAGERHQMALDPERAADRCRQTAAVEQHRSLLDVELEVRRSPRRADRRADGACSRSTPHAASASTSVTPSASRARRRRRDERAWRMPRSRAGCG